MRKRELRKVYITREQRTCETFQENDTIELKEGHNPQYWIQTS